jgi:hypothetical protein
MQTDLRNSVSHTLFSLNLHIKPNRERMLYTVILAMAFGKWGMVSVTCFYAKKYRVFHVNFCRGESRVS